MQGWLNKKGKRRYFVLMKDVVMWFTEDPNETRKNTKVNDTKDVKNNDVMLTLSTTLYNVFEP